MILDFAEGTKPSQVVDQDDSTPLQSVLASSRMGTLPWEEERLASMMHNKTKSLSPSVTLQIWGQLRADTVPWMIPFSDRKVHPSRIRLENGKFR